MWHTNRWDQRKPRVTNTTQKWQGGVTFMTIGLYSNVKDDTWQLMELAWLAQPSTTPWRSTYVELRILHLAAETAHEHRSPSSFGKENEYWTQKRQVVQRVGLAGTGGNRGPEAGGVWVFFFLKAPPPRNVEEKGTVHEPLRLASWGPHRRSGLR